MPMDKMPMSDPGDRQRRVADRAYELYRSRGGGEGRHVEDWLEAERLIEAEDRSADGTTPAERDTQSQVPRGTRRKRGKSATL